VHVPIGVELGGAKVAAGGWAIKTRHSWGKAQTCESCHGDPATFIGAELRQAEFVSFWSAKHANARFVDEALVKRITVGAADLQQSPHRGMACERCHQSRANDACSGCHGASGRGRTRVAFRTTAELLELSRPGGARAAGWTELRNRYLDAGNEFHRNPRAAVAQIRSVRQDAARYKRKLDSANRKPADQVAK